MTILIFPWAARLVPEGKPSPKNYPWWPEVVSQLKKKGYALDQVSCTGEPDLGCDTRYNDTSLQGIESLLRQCETWISVDSFVPHLAALIGSPGVVIFGFSDPDIFGHKEHINLLKNRRYLRENQFWLWSQQEPNPDVFVPPDHVVATVMLSIEKRRR